MSILASEAGCLAGELPSIHRAPRLVRPNMLLQVAFLEYGGECDSALWRNAAQESGCAARQLVESPVRLIREDQRSGKVKRRRIRRAPRIRIQARSKHKVARPKHALELECGNCGRRTVIAGC